MRLALARPAMLAIALPSVLAIALPVALAIAPACTDVAPSPDASSSGASSSGASSPADPAETPPRAASPAELALVAPLAAGARLDDFDVREVRSTASDLRPGAIQILCEKGSARVLLSVVLATDGGPTPPASADRYAVFYSLRGATPEDGERLSQSLASFLRANKAVPQPPGLGPYVVKPLSL